MKNGYNQGDMKPEVHDFQKPESSYCQKFDQAPLNYVEREDRRQANAGKKLRGEAYKGRYSK